MTTTRVILATLLVFAAASAIAQTDDFFRLAGSGTAQEVQAAIAQGANVNAQDKDGKTPLIASTFNPDSMVMATLLKAGADVNARQKDGGTALMAAAVSNPPETIALLLKSGANVNDQDNDGGSPLIWAAIFNPNPEVILVLLKAGADPKAKTKDGKTAFDFAQENPSLKGSAAFTTLQAASE